ncbi:MAG: MarR family transcriptional regulator [Burkholderiaceae bacterium]|jgi:DNA-binding MarR family transcriptional regulator|nr:MarR family transcriptional regulator [Burkholderiaceae bacterium]
MSESVSDEQLFQLFLRTGKWLMRGQRHGARAAHGNEGLDEHIRRQLHADGQARHAQGRILFILSERDGLGQRELLDMLHVRSATLSELLRKLEKERLILRQRDENDKRNWRLFVTPSGHAVLQVHRQRQQETASRLFAVLSATERASLAALLGRLLALWEAAATNQARPAAGDGAPPPPGQSQARRKPAPKTPASARRRGREQ